MQKSDYCPLVLLLTEEKDELYTRRQNYLNNLSCQYSEAYWYISELLCLRVPSKVTRNPGGYLSMQRQALLWNSLLSSYNAVHEILHSLSWKIKHLVPSRYQKEPLTFSGTLSFWNNDKRKTSWWEKEPEKSPKPKITGAAQLQYHEVTSAFCCCWFVCKEVPRM